MTTLYYFEEAYCEKVNEDGDDIIFGIPVLKEGRLLWLMHPDHVPQFLDAAKQAGLNPVKFDFEKMGGLLKCP